MARKTSDEDFSPILNAARKWIDKSLIGDASIFSAELIWTQPFAAELKRFFVDSLDESDAKFIDKLERQLGPASQTAKQLMAEILWVLCLFPSNSKPATKRTQLFRIWSLGGPVPATDHPMLSDAVLLGVGSAGTAYLTQHWREVSYLILLIIKFKALGQQERKAIFASHGSFSDWLDTLPETLSRQFPHMLLYFAFPDEVERISSSREKHKILSGFGISGSKNWSNRKLDEEILSIRKRLEGEFPGQILDFYRPPLVARWKSADEVAPAVKEDPDSQQTSPPQAAALPTVPTNLILYGPPGTGKTYDLQRRQAIYTETPQPQDRGAWLESLVTDFGWRAVIAAAIDRIGPTAVPAIRDHELIKAKVRQRQVGRNVGQQIWGCLQRHTPQSVSTVQFGLRAEPFIFTKSADSVWSLLPDWRSTDDEAAKLATLYRTGPTASTPPIKRFRQVTFHPSFSYEDFVRGIRPVATGEDGRTEFRLVDGVLKQICDEARANPTKRYALFIDEINRGNIAKIFGELITLIESDKRLTIGPSGEITGGMSVQLPGGGGSDVAEVPFGVPANLDLYGTMNTADRSIALLDIALRRRFEFQEMEPRYDLLTGLVGGIDRAALLRRINDRLEYLLDRDRRIGHAYLMKASTLEDLRKAFATQIIPLLQEYFFDDLAKVALTLAGPNGTSPFVSQEKLLHEQLFPGAQRNVGNAGRARFLVTPSANWKEADFAAIYAAATEAVDSEA